MYRCKVQKGNEIWEKEIKKLILEKLDVKVMDAPPAAKVPDSTAVNLWEEVSVGEEMTINYTYTDMGGQLMILDIGARVSISGSHG